MCKPPLSGVLAVPPWSTELLGDLLKQKPKVDESVDNIIVVDNAPKVGP